MNYGRKGYENTCKSKVDDRLKSIWQSNIELAFVRIFEMKGNATGMKPLVYYPMMISV